MIDTKTIDRLADRVSKVLPPGIAQAREDIHENVRDVLMRGLREVDLVTREEFDVQTRALRRARDKLDTMEERLAALEGDTND